MKASIYNSELEFISKCVLDYENLETGGDLFGYWDKNGNPVVQYATGPGKSTTRTGTSFFQDISYLHECVQYFHKNYALEQIGSWHSHHKLGLPNPSGGDESTMRNCLNTHDINKFLVVICNISPTKNKEVNINGFVFSKENRCLYEEIKWVTLLSKENPIRKYIDKDVRFITNPKTKKASYKILKEYPDEYTSINQNEQQPQKPTFPTNYYFHTKEGQEFIRKEFEKVKNEQGVSNVEIIQNEDKTVSITFDWEEKKYEVNYPLDYSKENPRPIIKGGTNTNQNIKIEEEKNYYLIVDTFSFIEDFFASFRNNFLNFRINHGMDI
jgi:hypothetical protein